MSDLPRACIVLPCYNEAVNIPILMPLIFEQAPRIASHELHVLVVDDNSPDGTADIVRGLQPQFPNLHLISGEKQGLGEAYKRGMAAAIEKLAPEFILEMDADLQHSPSLLPVFVALGDGGFDLVIGSRFVVGGSTPHFSLRRRAMSLFGNFLLRIFGGLPALRDCTSGYRLIRTEILQRCDLTPLATKGYSFQSSLLFELIRNGAKPIEVPITFPDRTHGASKLAFSDQLEFLLNIARIRFRKSQEFISFCAVGLSGVFVNLGFFIFLTRWLGLSSHAGSPIAIELSIISNFILNNAFTFRARGVTTSLRRRFVQFHVVSGIAGVINYITMLLFVQFGLWDILGQLAGIVLGTFINYVLNSVWTWRDVESVQPFAVEKAVSEAQTKKRRRRPRSDSAPPSA